MKAKNNNKWLRVSEREKIPQKLSRSLLKSTYLLTKFPFLFFALNLRRHYVNFSLFSLYTSRIPTRAKKKKTRKLNKSERKQNYTWYQWMLILHFEYICCSHCKINFHPGDMRMWHDKCHKCQSHVVKSK